MELAGSVVKDVSVLRRMLFATSYLPEELPHYWEIIAAFSCLGSTSSLNADSVKLLMENLHLLNTQAFTTDVKLTKELLYSSSKLSKSEPLGVTLISEKKACRICGDQLLVRRDRPSNVILYTENMGTVPATHYHKFCRNQRR